MEVHVLALVSQDCHRWGSPEAEAKIEFQVQAVYLGISAEKGEEQDWAEVEL